MYSLAEAKADGLSVPLAIYHDETMVGFVMYWFDVKTGTGYIERLMVDAQYQGRGYGKAALAEVMNRLIATPGCRKLDISYRPENAVAKALYCSLGFRPTGEIEDGEEIAVYEVS
jgi:diamine N-acetyltransferase